MKKLEVENRDRLSEYSNLRLIIEGFCNAKVMVSLDGVNPDTKIVFDYICQHMQLKKCTPLAGEELQGEVQGEIRKLGI